MTARAFNPRPADFYGQRISRHTPGWRAAAAKATGELTERQRVSRAAVSWQAQFFASARTAVVHPADWRGIVRKALAGRAALRAAAVTADLPADAMATT